MKNNYKTLVLSKVEVIKRYSAKALFICLFLLLNISSFAQNWNEVIKAVASDRGTGDFFGWSVSINGNYAIVGAVWEGQDTTRGAGSAYIFERDSNGNWNEVQKIVASDRGVNDWFGISVSISGNYILVGANGQDEDTTGGNTLSRAGSAYIFERDSSGIWNEVQKIVASDRGVDDEFGYSVSINGNYALVGAHREDEDITGGNTLIRAGSAYIFERDSSGNWNEVQKIVASDRGIGDTFGWSVSISGNYALVGARLEDEDATGGNTLISAGSAYIFERDSNGIWNEVQKIVASDRGANDLFGGSVSISGNYAIVGAFSEDEDTTGGNTLTNAGSAYIFERDNSGIWNEVQKIIASDREFGDRFGISVSISGNCVIVGAFIENEDATGGNTLSEAGSAYIFERDSSGIWNEVQKIVASDREINDLFGWSVSISGNYALVGAHREDEDITGGNTLNNAGSAYIFKLCLPTTNSFFATACDSYTVPSGNETYTTSQTVMDTISNAAGCDSVMTISLTINTADVSVTNKSPTLTANATRAGYQWLYCDSSFAIISSDTNQAFTATIDGSYAVEITENGCIDTSACYTIVNVGIVENSFGNELLVYPNPTKGNFLIDLGTTHQLTTVSITDLSGKLIYNNTYKQIQIINLEINESAGVYFITLESEEKRAVIKLAKE